MLHGPSPRLTYFRKDIRQGPQHLVGIFMEPQIIYERHANMGE